LFSTAPHFFNQKREKVGKITSGPVKCISVVQKEPFLDTYLIGFQA